MCPHSDTASTAGDIDAGVNHVSYGTTPALRHDSVTSTDSQASYASSFGNVERGMKAEASPRPLVPGVYVPTLCFFNPDTEDVDTDMIARHAAHLARSGVSGLATQGSNGEAVHLNSGERRLVTTTTRNALDESGYPHLPVIVGCGSQSTRETIQHCQDAHEAGGDYALVLPPSYYASLFAPASQTILNFFTAVASRSPIPVIIYNFPGAVGGMDLSSDLIIKLAEHPNIVGVKLTCGNTGKLNRVAAATRKMARSYNPHRPDFLVLSGSADFLLQSLAAGGHGCLAGLANIAPRACLSVLRLYKEGNMSEAQELQEKLSDADWVAIQGGVIGVKSGMESWTGYGGYARSPLPRPTKEQAVQWKEGFRQIVVLEKSM